MVGTVRLRAHGPATTISTSGMRAASTRTRPVGSGFMACQDEAARRHETPKRDSCTRRADVRSYAPWALMGRVTKSGALLEENIDLQIQLKLKIAAKELDESQVHIAQRYEALLSLLPDFEARVLKLPQTQVTELLSDVNEIARRMIELKRLLPPCDVDAIVNSCPRLVLNEDWPVVKAATQQLRTIYASEDDIAALVQLNPVILHQDVQYVLSELQRLYNYKTPADAARHLRARPDIVFLLEKGLRGVGPATE